MKIRSQSITMVDVNSLIPHPKNCHDHPPEQLERLCKIIEYQGFRNPLTVQAGTNLIVTGHGRALAAKKLGMKEVPVIYQEFESDEQLYAHLVADNAIGKDTWATLDLGMINLELENLGPELDIDLLGLKDFVIEPIEKLDPQADEDEVPEVIDPIAKKGDIWLLGNHRVMCGDSTMIDDIEKLMDGQTADMVFTSPPYNANAKTGDGDIFNGKKSKNMYEGKFVDNQDSSVYIQFAKDVLDMCFSFTDGFIFWNVSYNANSRFEYILQIEDRLNFLIEQICWKKSSTIPFKGSMMRDWEPIFLFSTGGNTLGLSSVVSNHWEVSNTNSQGENHKACFPIALPEKAIMMLEKSKIVLDPFLGSGSTLIACEKTNRKCYGMELDEKYCDVIVNRWQNYTGKEAKLESSGETYNSLKE